jgi:translocation and assembly module TamB
MSLGSRLARVSKYLLMSFLLFLLLVSAALWYVTTDSFQQMVRHRLIASLERATGGRVELGSFHAVPLRFRVEVQDLTIHGRESSAELPLAHVDRMSAVVNISSALGARLAFHSLILEHPVVHLVFYPDGSTNQPSPKRESPADLAQLFSGSIDRLEVRHGEVALQDQRWPLDFVSNDVSARLSYSFLRSRYSGDAAVGRAEIHFEDFRPLAWAGQAVFSIDAGGLQVQSLTASSENSKLQARGVISDFRHPRVRASYDVLIDLQQAAAITRQAGLKEGTLELQGTGDWSTETFSAGGLFDLRNLGWHDRNLETKNTSAKGQYRIDPAKIQLSQVQGRVFHGTFEADAETVDWITAGRSNRKGKRSTRGSAKVQAKDVALSELLASLGPRFRAVSNLRLAGELSGISDVQWKDSVRNAEITSNLKVSAPNRFSPGQVPLSANAQFTYHLRPSTLDVAAFSADTPSSQVRGSGKLANSMTMARLSFFTTDLREWQPLMAAAFPAGSPLSLHGRAAFNGSASGALSNLNLAGRLQLQNFDTTLPQSAGASALHLDSLGTELQISSRNLAVRDAVVRSGNTTVRIAGEAGLANWRLTPSSALTLHLELENADAAELGTQLSPDIALNGRLNARLEIGGTRSDPQAEGTMDWTNGAIQGHSFDALRAAVFIRGPQAGFDHLELARGEARVSGNGVYNLAARTFQLNLSGNNFSMADVPALQRSRVSLGGRLDFTAGVSGSRNHPAINAQLHVRDLAFNHERAGDYWIDASTHGDEIDLKGHSDFKTAQLTMDGNIHPRERWPSHIAMHFLRLDADPFIESYMHGRVTGHSSIGGDLVIEGPLLDPERLNVTGNFADVSVEVERVKLHNEGPLQFSFSEGTLRLDHVRIAGDQTDFLATGTVQLNGEKRLDIGAHGEIGLQLLQTYDPDLSGSGKIQIDSVLKGTLSAPLAQGKIQIENASVSDINLPSALSSLNGTLSFNQNQLTIEKLTAQTGGGNISFGGRAELAGRQLNFDLTASADAVRLRYPPGVSSTATAKLHWSGSTSGSLLSGDVTIMKLGVTPGFDFGAYLQKTVQQTSLPQTDPVLNKIRLDLHVTTTPELQMQTNVIRLRGDADLHVRGNAAKPVLLGRADIFEGEAYFNGTKYRLERGGVTFGTPAANNPAGTVPYVDFQATTRVKDYDITLSINGPADRPKLSYRSEPPLPTNDIIGLLAFGGTSEESAQLQQSSQSAFSQQASNAMLAAALNAALNNRAQRLFGNSRIKIDPQGLETETSPTQSGPAVTIEQQVKDNLTLTYTTNVSQTSQQIIRAEYNVSRSVSIVAIRDQNGVISFDVKIRRRKR